MNPAPHIALYEFEAAIEKGFRRLFEPQGFTVNTPDDFDFQRPTPRVEFQFRCGPATDHRSTHDDIYRVDSFTGELTVTTLTLTKYGEADEPTEAAQSNAYREHSKVRAKVRYLMGRCESDFTWRRDYFGNDWLPYHDLNRVFPNGDEPVMKAETGHLVTTSRYEIHFNIKSTAWPATEIEAPINFIVTGGQGQYSASWNNPGPLPALDYLIQFGPSAGNYTVEQSVDRLLVAGGWAYGTPGTYYARILVRNTPTDFVAGTPVDVQFTVSGSP